MRCSSYFWITPDVRTRVSGGDLQTPLDSPHSCKLGVSTTKSLRLLLRADVRAVSSPGNVVPGLNLFPAILPLELVLSLYELP